MPTTCKGFDRKVKRMKSTSSYRGLEKLEVKEFNVSKF